MRERKKEERGEKVWVEKASIKATVRKLEILLNVTKTHLLSSIRLSCFSFNLCYSLWMSTDTVKKDTEMQRQFRIERIVFLRNSARTICFSYVENEF